MRYDLEGLNQADQQTKPPNADVEWSQLLALYEDQSRSSTRAHLAEMGMGLRDGLPLDMGRMLRQVVDRAATVYRNPPSRYLVSSTGRRLAETRGEHQAMLEALNRAQYDVTWRRADRLRTLLQQVGLRFYPSDHRGSVVVRIFAPHQIKREVDPACSDMMDHDSRFSLELSGDLREYWCRHPEDPSVWTMAWVTKDGALLPRERQPLAESLDVVDGHPYYVSPYPMLPVQMVYADHAGGAPWLPPGESRQAWVRNLTALVNDVMALVKLQAHNTRVFKRNNPNSVLPADTGPNVTVAIDREEELVDLKPSPAIEECLSVIKLFSRLFATSEYLPGSEFDPEKQILTGAALRVQLQPLYDRREDQVPLVAADELSAFRRLRAVHNVHAAGWGVATLSTDYELEVEVAELEAPTTPTEAGNIAARNIAYGVQSVIDLIQQETSCTRPEAVKRYERVKGDLEAYPPLMSVGEVDPTDTGPKPTDPPGPVAADEQPDAVLDGLASVADAVRG